MKSLFIAVALVAACSVADAAEVKKDTTKAPAVSAKAMTDKDMDKVTAGAGYGIQTACDNGGTCNYPTVNDAASSRVSPGSGVNTRN